VSGVPEVIEDEKHSLLSEEFPEDYAALIFVIALFRASQRSNDATLKVSKVGLLP
jgi:hypothetical protein